MPRGRQDLRDRRDRKVLRDLRDRRDRKVLRATRATQGQQVRKDPRARSGHRVNREQLDNGALQDHRVFRGLTVRRECRVSLV